ncbi:MAG: macro domain-containing protein [Lachnospiraceae bacterium]|nr:macro domain-containing protein [Lachnospiraceae bacterium]
MPFKIVRNDITKMQVDAIVNTANAQPVYSSGTDTAVYRAAGEEELLAERKKIGVLKEGDVALTPGFALPAKYILHAVSPKYRGGLFSEEKKLRACYKKSLELAYEKQCESIAFPLIATGGFGYPKEEGIRIAIDEINGFLLSHEMLVYLVVFDEASTELGRKLAPDLKSYIDRNYVEEKQEEEYSEACVRVPTEAEETVCIRAPHFLSERRASADDSEEFEEQVVYSRCAAPSRNTKKAESSYDDFVEESQAAIKERLKHRADTFQQYLFYLIKIKGLSNAEVYRRAIVTKQLFSKIKMNPDYHPDKATAMRLCVGVGLSLDETKDLLARAGYALSPSDMRDIIFSFFIEQEVFDMIEIDIALEEYGLPCFIE